MSDIHYYIDTVCDTIAAFDCGHRVFNTYLSQRNDTAVVHYIIDASTDQLVAYFSLLASSILYGTPENLSAISAIELKMFALDKNYQGHDLAPSLLDDIIKTVRFYSDNYVGADILLLYSIPVDYVLKLYDNKGFKQLGKMHTAFRSSFTDGCIPMFLAL